MARFADIIGIATTVEVTPGIFKEVFTEITYVGDVIRNTRRWQEGQKVNDDLVVNNRISIVADAYALDHFSEMRYVKLNGVLWKITDIEILKPRLVLTLGGRFNAST